MARRKAKKNELLWGAFILIAAILVAYLALIGISVQTKTVAYDKSNLVIASAVCYIYNTTDDSSTEASVAISDLTFSVDTNLNVYIYYIKLNITFDELASKGFNYLHLKVSIPGGNWSDADVVLAAHTTSWPVYFIGTIVFNGTSGELTAFIDPAAFSLWVASKNIGSEYVWIHLQNPDEKSTQTAPTLTIDDIEFYTLGKQPLLSALLNPTAPVLSGVVGAIITAWERVKDWVWGALTGSGLGFLFTGLFENPWIAAIIAIGFLVVIYYFATSKYKKRRQRRR